MPFREKDWRNFIITSNVWNEIIINRKYVVDVNDDNNICTIESSIMVFIVTLFSNSVRLINVCDKLCVW